MKRNILMTRLTALSLGVLCVIAGLTIGGTSAHASTARPATANAPAASSPEVPMVGWSPVDQKTLRTPPGPLGRISQMPATGPHGERFTDPTKVGVGGRVALSLIAGKGFNSKYPYSATVFLETTYKNGTVSKCTGTMVGPNAVLTAGHCVYNASKKGWAETVDLVPGYDAGRAPFSRVFATELWTTQKWTKGDHKMDVAVVKLNKDIGNETGWLGLQTADWSTRGQELTFHGYPGMKSDSMYQGRVKVKNVGTSELCYDYGHQTGESGSGLFESNGRIKGIVVQSRGYHGSGSSCKSDQDVAVSMRDPIFDAIRSLL